ncbi:unnamed protein product [Symbiodinium pilosum]|uniref:CCHC-type domain-containing protein n=1 Tax=Symbiodinium pilosum TaxID=2952 RepID=A0A812RGG5_SYMPI|nr:unnamed protein product [Symbiodinium pilosum]
MNDYVTRKFEAYFRASQALQRVAPHYIGGGSIAGGDQRPGNSSYDWESSNWTWARTNRPSAEPEEQSRRSSVSSDGSTEVPPSGAPTATTSTWDDAAWRQWNSQWNHWSSWSGYGNWEWKSGHSGAAPPRDLQMQNTDLLPPFIQGWYLLADAGLDHNEKNLVMTALGGDFNPQRVAQELRNQFPDGEVRRRDQTRRYQSYMGEFLDESEDDLDISGNTSEALIEEGLTSEGVALVVDAESQAQEALAALHQARRTLKEARFKQHQVKQSRRYYHSGSQGKGSSSSGAGTRDDSNLDCLRCGQRGHRAANCPHKPVAAHTDGGPHGGSGENQQAPFVCFAAPTTGRPFAGFAQDTSKAGSEEAYGAIGSPGALTTAEAVKRGMCVLDGGATQTIGSIAALEAVMTENVRKHGVSRLKAVSTQNTPTFSFGNSSEDKCLSTAKIGVSANGVLGELSAHALDKGQSPILLSVEALRRLGAVIDFKEDLAVFRSLDSKRVVKLSRGQSGHQLLPLTEDWLADMVLALRSFGEEPPSGWTKVDLMCRLGELSDLGEIEMKSGKAAKTPLQQAVSELNKASRKKSELVLHVEKNLGMLVSPNATIATIQKAAMQQLLADIPGADGDVMGFGKFSERTYLEVWSTETSYCGWAKDTYKEESTSIYLRRFVEWMLQKEVSGTKPKVVVGSPKKKSNPTKSPYKMEAKSATMETPSASSAASPDAVTQLTAMVAQLATEIKEMKEERASAQPRKVAATQDIPMVQKPKDFRLVRPLPVLLHTSLNL